MAGLQSENVVIQSPMSFTGSTARAMKLTKAGPGYNPQGSFGNKLLVISAKVLFYTLTFVLIALWWIAIVCWYLIFGILVIPWRLFRRGSRKRKRDNLRHQEMLDAMKNKK